MSRHEVDWDDDYIGNWVYCIGYWAYCIDWAYCVGNWAYCIGWAYYIESDDYIDNCDAFFVHNAYRRKTPLSDPPLGPKL